MATPEFGLNLSRTTNDLKPPRILDTTEAMKLLVTILASLFLLAVFAFCVFGFMATFEPTDRTAEFFAFRIGYAVVGVGCVIGLGVLLVKAMGKPNEPPS